MRLKTYPVISGTCCNGHAHTCYAGGEADCVNLCNYNKRFNRTPVVTNPQAVCTCEQCGKPCVGISYCGCKGWE